MRALDWSWALSSLRFLRRVSVGALGLCLGLGLGFDSGEARAQSAPVTVDRDAIVAQLRQMSEQVAAIEQQVGQPGGGPRRAIGRDVLARATWLRQALAGLEQSVAQAPSAQCVGVGPTPFVVATTPFPGGPGVTPGTAQVVVPLPGLQVQTPTQPGQVIYAPQGPSYAPQGPGYAPQGPGYAPSGPGQPPIAYAPPQATVAVIDEGTLGEVLAHIHNEAFSQDKLRIVSDVASAHYFLVAQVQRVIGEFSFSSEKLRALELLQPRILDRNNAFRIYEVFTFSTDKEKARRIMGR